MLRLIALLALTPCAAAWQDCNESGLPDAVDIQMGISLDCDQDGVPDECQFGQVLFNETFDGNPIIPAGVTYTTTSIWGVDIACRPNGGGGVWNYMYWGNSPPCNFIQYGSAGYFSINDLPLPDERTVTLQYWSYYEGEFGGSGGCDPYFPTDYAYVVLIDESGIGHDVDSLCSPEPVGWAYRTVDLSAFAGQTVRLAWGFIPGDGLYNDFFGWGIDNIRVTTMEDISGNGVPDHCERISQTYCSSNPNSTGFVSGLAALGSRDVQDEDLFLRTLTVPQNQFGYYLMSATQGQLALPAPSQGILCLGLPFLRFNQVHPVLNSGTIGELRMRVEFPNLPQQTVIQPGDTWNFQCWFRDGASSNTSRAVAVTFL